MPSELPEITVVIPAYNEEAYLPSCLEALKEQTYPKDKYSILVVDNNSTDKTAEIAQQFGAKVIHEHQQGHVFSLNAGLQNATGDIYAVTDSDTQPASNWLQTLAKSFEDPEVVGVTGSVIVNFKSSIGKWLLYYLYQLFLTFNFALNKPHFAGPNMAIRASAFKMLHGVDTRYRMSGDVEIGMRLKKFGKVRFVKNLVTTTSPRRLNGGWLGLWKDIRKYSSAYIYAIWLVKPPKDALVPIRES